MPISIDSMKTPHHEWVHTQFVRKWSTTNAYGGGGNRWPRSLKSCLWLCECFGIQCFGIGGNTNYEVCEGKYLVFWSKTRSSNFFLILETQAPFYSSRILSTISHVMFEQNHATFDTILRMTTRIVGQLAKMLGLQQNNGRTFHPFWVDFVVGNSYKLQKLGLEGKTS
jgi:hypothetical protein